MQITLRSSFTLKIQLVLLLSIYKIQSTELRLVQTVASLMDVPAVSKLPGLPQGCRYTQTLVRVRVYCRGPNNWDKNTSFPDVIHELKIVRVSTNETIFVSLLRKSQSLETLKLFKTGIVRLTRSLFSSVSNLRELQIGYHDLMTYAETNSLSTLSKLERFRFAYCKYISLENIGDIVGAANLTRLQTVVFDSIGVNAQASRPVLKPEFFRNFKHSPVTTTVFSSDMITGIFAGFTPHIINVECLILTRNDITTTFTAMAEGFVLLRHVRLFDISFQGGMKGTPVTPRLENICKEPFDALTEIKQLDAAYVKHTENLYNDHKLCPVKLWMSPNLRFAFIHNLHQGLTLKTYLPNFCIHYSNQLRLIDFHNDDYNLTVPVIGLLRLEYANLQNINQNYVPYHSIAHLFALKTVLFGGNNLGSWIAEGNATYSMANLPNLLSVDLAENGITRISNVDLQFLMNLLYLNLSGNALNVESLDVDISLKFSHLRLERNGFTHLPTRFRDAFDILILQSGSHIIHMIDNPFQCNCDTQAFIRWFQNRVTYFDQGETYTCQRDSRTNERLVDVDVEALHRRCMWTFTKTVIITATTISSIFVILGAVLLHRYRRVLHYYVFFQLYIRYKQVRLKTSGTGFHRLVEEASPIDVYVVSSRNDGEFVNGELAKSLRDRGLGLTIGDIDFLGGRDITTEIIDTMKRSDCALLVVSSNLVASHYIDFEITWALILNRRVLVISLNDPPIRLMPSSLLYLYKRYVCQRYPTSIENVDNLAQKQKFWNNVNMGIRAFFNPQPSR